MKINYRTVSTCFALFLTLLFSGCFPERITWSPDGEKAAYLSEKGLHLLDRDGHLSPLLVPDAHLAAWNQSTGALLSARTLEIKTWEEARSLLDEKLVGEIIKTTRNIVESTRSGNGLERVDSFVESISMEEHIQELLIWLCLRDSHTDWVDRFMEISPEAGKEIGEIAAELTEIQIHTVDGTTISNSRTIAQIPDTILSFRISPTREWACGTTFPNDDNDLARNYLVNLKTGLMTLLSGNTSAHPDWSRDGLSLYSIRANSRAGKDNLPSLGVLVEQRLLDEKGELLDSFPEKELAGLFYNSMSRVRVDSKGRIFFSSIGVSLPATSSQFPDTMQVYVYDPAQFSTVINPLPPRIYSKIPNDELLLFELSPDAGSMSIGFQNGEVWLVDLQTGGLDVLESGSTKKSHGFISVPTWSPRNELTYVSLYSDNFMKKEGITRKGDFFLWKDGESQCLSRDWPDEAIEDVLK